MNLPVDLTFLNVGDPTHFCHPFRVSPDTAIWLKRKAGWYVLSELPDTHVCSRAAPRSPPPQPGLGLVILDAGLKSPLWVCLPSPSFAYSLHPFTLNF